MSATTYLLSRLSNPQQLTISVATREKFVSSGIIKGAPDSKGFDHLTFPNNKNLRLDNPNCIFDKIPYEVNGTAFLEYLGVQSEVAIKIFNDAFVRTHGVTDGEALFNQVKLYAEQLSTTLDENSFTKDVITDVMRLMHMATQVPAIMNSYRANSAANKPFHLLTELDYLVKILLERIANLLCLSRAIDQYIQS